MNELAREHTRKEKMDEIELHISVNADVVIPEWLRRKMGLKDEEAVSDSDTDGESKAIEEELRRLEDAIKRCSNARYRTTIFRDVSRGEDRG